MSRSGFQHSQQEVSNIHLHIMDLMEVAGYPVGDKVGFCFGLAAMGGSAVLVNDIETFNERIRFLATFSVDDFQKLYSVFVGDKNNAELEKKSFNDVLESNPIYKKLQQDVLPFFDGVTLYQDAYKQPWLFEPGKQLHHQDIINTAPLVQSHKLDDEKGIAKNVATQDVADSFTGIYSTDEIVDYLESFKKEFYSDPKTAEAVVLNIVSRDHAISVSYNPVKKIWLLIDANVLPIKEFFDSGQLAINLKKSLQGAITERVLHSSFDSNYIAFRTKIICTDKSVSHIKENLSKWYHNDDYQKLHHISEKKAGVIDQIGCTWAYLEYVYANGGKKGIELFNKNVEFNAKQLTNYINEKGIANIDINYQNQQKFTPLMAAVFNQDSELVRALLRNGADVNLINEFKDSALHIAARLGNSKVVSLLLTEATMPINTVGKNCFELDAEDLANKCKERSIARNIVSARQDLFESYNYYIYENRFYLDAPEVCFKKLEEFHLAGVDPLIGVWRFLSIPSASPEKNAIISGYFQISAKNLKTPDSLLKPMPHPEIEGKFFSPIKNALKKNLSGMLKTILDVQLQPIQLDGKNYSVNDFLLSTSFQLDDKMLEILFNHQNGIKADELLLYAVKTKKIELAKIALDNKANPNLADRYGLGNVLTKAVDTKNLEMVKLLVKAGADVSYGGDTSLSVVKLAKNKESPEIFEFLNQKKQIVDSAKRAIFAAKPKREDLIKGIKSAAMLSFLSGFNANHSIRSVPILTKLQEATDKLAKCMQKHAELGNIENSEAVAHEAEKILKPIMQRYIDGTEMTEKDLSNLSKQIAKQALYQLKLDPSIQDHLPNTLYFKGKKDFFGRTQTLDKIFELNKLLNSFPELTEPQQIKLVLNQFDDYHRSSPHLFTRDQHSFFTKLKTHLVDLCHDYQGAEKASSNDAIDAVLSKIYTSKWESQNTNKCALLKEKLKQSIEQPPADVSVGQSPRLT